MLVKLQCAWDRCILLAGKWKLSPSQGHKLVFTHPDVTIDDREKFKHRLAEQKLHRRAGEEGTDVMEHHDSS